MFQDGSVGTILAASRVCPQSSRPFCLATRGEPRSFAKLTPVCNLNPRCLLVVKSAESARHAQQAFYELHRTRRCSHLPCFTPNWFVPTASFSTISGLLTLFSKFFSSFLHSTCSLSVSHHYLVLGEVYLPLRAAIPNNPTLWRPAFGSTEAQYGIFTLFDALFQGTYAPVSPFANLFRLQFGGGTPQILDLDSCRFARRYWGNLR